MMLDRLAEQVDTDTESPFIVIVEPQIIGYLCHMNF